MSGTMKTLVAVAYLFSTATSHMIMTNPPPFSNPPPDSSPLSSSGANFPCKYDGSAGFYQTSNRTSIAIGSPQTLEFKPGGAHHGGSCQLAVTHDTAPTASSSWQVLLSIEGGCITADQTDPTFQWTIPEGVATGDATFGWTWISKLAGQPEYYMNCAPITITGGGSAKRDVEHLEKRADLPQLFVANLASINDCKAGAVGGGAGTDVVYPDPGTNVINHANPAGKPIGTNCVPKNQVAGSSSGSSGSGSSGSSSSAAGASSSAASSPATSATSDAAPAPPPSSKPATASTLATSGTSAASSSSSPTTLVSITMPANPTTATPAAGTGSSAATAGTEYSPSATSPVASGPSSSSGGNSSSSGGSTTTAAGQLSGACTSEGQWNCLSTGSGLAFQRCASGSWTGMTPLAAGQTCINGLSMTLWKRADWKVRGRRVPV